MEIMIELLKKPKTITMNEQKRKEETEREAEKKYPTIKNALFTSDESANVLTKLCRSAFTAGITSDLAKKFERETAIEFYNWRLENEYEIDVREQREHTDDELFTLFLNSKKQEK